MGSRRLPVVFFGHGDPMNAVLSNTFTEGWRAVGDSLPRPRAVPCVSAHWYTFDTRVTASVRPPTVHDFGGFPRELYDVQYPAPGDPELAAQVAELLGPVPVALDDSSWGLDHGTWSVMAHVFPDADVPVVQLSIDATKSASFHYELGTRLELLREDGVLIIDSGNLVHNLHAYSWGGHPAEPYDWAVRFEREVRRLLAEHEHDLLMRYQTPDPDAALSVPTPDHYLPLLYCIGSTGSDGEVGFPVEGIDGGSISMLAVRIG